MIKQNIGSLIRHQEQKQLLMKVIVHAVFELIYCNIISNIHKSLGKN